MRGAGVRGCRGVGVEMERIESLLNSRTLQNLLERLFASQPKSRTQAHKNVSPSPCFAILWEPLPLNLLFPAPLLLLILVTFTQTAHAAPITLKRGVNLEGWMSNPTFRVLENSDLTALEAIRKAGFDFVRLPLNPRFFIEARANAPEPRASLERILQAARKQNLKVVVSLYSEDDIKLEALKGGAARDTYLALLERLGMVLNPYGAAWVAFEPMDEPIDPSRPDCSPSSYDWNSVQGQFVSAARRGAPQLTLLVSGLCYSSAYSMIQMKPLEDKNLIYSFQFVDPLVFTQQGNPINAEWVGFKNIPYPVSEAKLRAQIPAMLKGVPDPKLRKAMAATLEDYAKSAYGEAQIRSELEGAQGWARQQNVSVMLKSFAVHSSAPRADRLRWFRDVRTLAENSKMPWAVWTWTSPYGFGLLEGGKLPLDMKKALGL